jgi:hypothetical protein
LRDYQEWLALMEEAERGDGWLAWCEAQGVYVAWNPPLVEALAGVLRECGGNALEVGAGDGLLARRLAEQGIEVRPTDPAPAALDVERLSCEEALARYAPRVVLACFPPLDAGIEQRVTTHPGVLQFIYLGPLINDRPGPEALWSEPGWERVPLPEVDRFLISRLDYLADFTRRTHRRRAGAVLLARQPGRTS